MRFLNIFIALMKKCPRARVRVKIILEFEEKCVRAGMRVKHIIRFFFFKKHS